ncbi:MAG: MetQ/NlpA family ABC transporter substrate-binding protein [Anaerococcus sp.]|jgi:D-methionine transport system substrate-binding protein|nr:MetQ/NlpA family ABC transporter substrate-binding protein [Peptoniphilaceae bacterium]MDY3055245.1 MetQ/NlpA family ABC transporter substrate-binding protein [Anaerococcus sp.]
MKNIKKLALTLAIGLLATSCGNKEANTDQGSDTATEKGQTIRVGLVGENNEVWEDVKERYEKDTGNKLELVTFTDYTEPNEALNAGDLDLNSFQHKKFLSDFNEENGTDLVEIGDTVLAPLGIYSSQIKSIDEIKDGDRIAIPDDSSNSARSLFLLQSAGLIKVDGNPGEAITIDDISENPKNLEIIELAASQTARSLDDVKASVINSGMAVDAGFIPTEDAIYLEDKDSPDSQIYVNVIAARNEDKDNELYKDLVENYYQTDQSAKVLEEVSKGSQVPSW